MSVKIKRVIFLFGLPLLIVIAASYTVSQISINKIEPPFPNAESIAQDDIQKIQEEASKSAQKFEESIADVIKIPVYFLTFDVYIQNRMRLSSECGAGIVIMNTDIEGKYVGNIRYGETRKISKISHQISELIYLPYTRSFSIDGQDLCTSEHLAPSDAYYIIFLKPSLSTMIVSYIAIFLLILTTTRSIIPAVRTYIKKGTSL